MVLWVVEVGELSQCPILTFLDSKFVGICEICAKRLVNLETFFHTCEQRAELLLFLREGDEDFDADEEAALEFDELGEIGEEEVDSVAVE